MSERLGLPSASKFEQIACCNGQPQLEAELRSRGMLSEEKSDEFAQRGTRIHKALETGDVSLLSEDEVVDYSRAKELDEQAVAQWALDKGVQPTEDDQFMEQRLWLLDGDQNQLCSGQYDRLTICGQHAYVRDFKSGFCKRLSASEQSWQLRLLAVLVWTHSVGKQLQTVRASFIKPKFGKTAIDTVEYSVDDLMRANNQIRQVLWQAQQPNAQRVAGDWCYYCPCRGVHCPESGAMAMLPISIAKASNAISKKEVVAAVDRLNSSDWKRIWERSTVIRNILDTVNDKLKSLNESELSGLGLQVGKGKRLDPITGTYGAFKVLEHTLPQEALWSCLKFSKTALVDALVTDKKLPKKDAETWVRENLSMFIQEKTSEGSLEEI